MIGSPSTYRLREVQGRTNRHRPTKKNIHFNRRLGIPRQHKVARKKTGKNWVVPRTRVVSPRARPAAKDNPTPTCWDRPRANITMLSVSNAVKSVSDVIQVEMIMAGGNTSQRMPANHPALSEVSRLPRNNRRSATQ